MSTAAQIAANQANAKLSTGPTTTDGKNTTKLNGLKTGLTGRTVVLPSDDLAAYQTHVESFYRKFEPATDEEHMLVQSIADTEWRLARIPSLEAGIYALGRLEFASLFEDHPADVRKSLIEAKTLLTYQRQLNNLGIQEKRLRRQRDEDTTALKARQDQRKHATYKKLTKSAFDLLDCLKNKTKFDPAANGFGFSMDEIERRAAEVNPGLFPHIKFSTYEKMSQARG